jgi:hypothetical protein
MNSGKEEVCLALTGTGGSFARMIQGKRSNNQRIARDAQANLQSEI